MATGKQNFVHALAPGVTVSASGEVLLNGQKPYFGLNLTLLVRPGTPSQTKPTPTHEGTEEDAERWDGLA